MICVLSLNRRYSPSLGVLLDQETAPGRVKPRGQRHDGAAYSQHPSRELDLEDPQPGQLALAQAALDWGLDKQPGLDVREHVVQISELLRRDNRTGFDPYGREPRPLQRHA